MNTKVETEARLPAVRDVAFQSHEEWVGFTGMPGIDRKHFDQTAQDLIAESPNAVIGRRAVIIPET